MNHPSYSVMFCERGGCPNLTLVLFEATRTVRLRLCSHHAILLVQDFQNFTLSRLQCKSCDPLASDRVVDELQPKNIFTRKQQDTLLLYSEEECPNIEPDIADQFDDELLQQVIKKHHSIITKVSLCRNMAEGGGGGCGFSETWFSGGLPISSEADSQLCLVGASRRVVAPSANSPK